MTATTRSADLAVEVGRFAHGRVPRDLRRRQVLAVAEELFAERGFYRTSMDELARRVGVSKPVVYDIVGSKEALFRALTEHAADEMAARVAGAVAGAQGAEARLRAGALAFFSFVGERRHVWSALITSDAAPLVSATDAIRKRQTELVVSLLEESAEKTAGDRELDALAHALNGAIEWLATWWQSEADLSADDMADFVTTLFMRGLEAFE